MSFREWMQRPEEIPGTMKLALVIAKSAAAIPASTASGPGSPHGYCALRSRCFAAAFLSLRSFLSFTDSLGLLWPDRLFCSLFAIAQFPGSWLGFDPVVRLGASITSSD